MVLEVIFRFLHGPKCVFKLLRIGQRTNRRRKNIQQILQFADVPDTVPLEYILDINFAEQVL